MHLNRKLEASKHIFGDNNITPFIDMLSKIAKRFFRNHATMKIQGVEASIPENDTVAKQQSN